MGSTIPFKGLAAVVGAFAAIVTITACGPDTAAVSGVPQSPQAAQQPVLEAPTVAQQPAPAAPAAAPVAVPAAPNVAQAPAPTPPAAAPNTPAVEGAAAAQGSTPATGGAAAVENTPVAEDATVDGENTDAAVEENIQATRTDNGEIALTIPSDTPEIVVTYNDPEPQTLTAAVTGGTAAVVLPAAADNIQIVAADGQAAVSAPIHVASPPLNVVPRNEDSTPVPTPTTPTPTPAPTTDPNVPWADYNCIGTDEIGWKYWIRDGSENVSNWWFTYCSQHLNAFAQATSTIATCKVTPGVGTVAEVAYTFPTPTKYLGDWGRTDVRAHGIVPGSATLNPDGTLKYVPRNQPVTSETTTVVLPYVFPELKKTPGLLSKAANGTWTEADGYFVAKFGPGVTETSSKNGFISVPPAVSPQALSWKPTDAPYRPAAFDAAHLGIQPGSRITANLDTQISAGAPYYAVTAPDENYNVFAGGSVCQ